MSKKKETIEIPLHLAKLLATRPEDVKEGTYEEVQEVSKSLLRLLMEVNK